MRPSFTVPILLLLVSACAESGEAPLVAEEVLRLHDQADQVIFGLEHHVTAAGIRKARILADTAFFLADQPVVELHGLTVNFYDSNGALTSILSSDAGTYDWDTGDMTATGSVVVINPQEGRRIETSIMHYDRLRHRIWGDEPTRMIEADGTIVQGSTFDSDASLTEVNLTSARLQKPEAAPSRPEEADTLSAGGP